MGGYLIKNSFLGFTLPMVERDWSFFKVYSEFDFGSKAFSHWFVNTPYELHTDLRRRRTPSSRHCTT